MANQHRKMPKYFTAKTQRTRRKSSSGTINHFAT
jgi:hypothetical protein